MGGFYRNADGTLRVKFVIEVLKLELVLETNSQSLKYLRVFVLKKSVYIKIGFSSYFLD